MRIMMSGECVFGIPMTALSEAENVLPMTRTIGGLVLHIRNYSTSMFCCYRGEMRKSIVRRVATLPKVHVMIETVALSAAAPIKTVLERKGSECRDGL